MRYYPEDEYDIEHSDRLEPEEWMLEALRLNPSYVSWGPSEDYMWNEGEGWQGRVIVEDWGSFNWDLNDLNECVNFYYEINRPSENCETCGGCGTHPDAQWVSDSFYSHSSPFKAETQRETEGRMIMQMFGGGQNKSAISAPDKESYPSEETLERYGQPFRDFCERLRDIKYWGGEHLRDEDTECLVVAGRYRDGGAVGHDAINRNIMVRDMAKRLGVPLACPTCEGHGNYFTGPAQLALVLWWLHPRKGCSRGIRIEKIEECELPLTYKFLAEAAERNAQRFSKVQDLADELS